MSVHIDWQPIEGRRASEAIYEQLRQQITSGHLKPGDRLPSERAMMQQLGRSRPTIREALRMLEQGGYVSSTHGASGAVVQELTLDGVEQPLTEMIQLNQISLEELGEYREVNDSTIAGWAAQRRTDEDIAALERCLAQAEESLGDYRRFVELDVEFHSLLSRATGNQVAVIVTDVLGSVEQQTLLKKMLTISAEDRRALARRILERHREILSAIRRQDADSARQAMREHTRAAGQDLKV